MIRSREQVLIPTARPDDDSPRHQITGARALTSIDSAVALARQLGLADATARVLHVGNNVTVHLPPAPVVAKVCATPVPHARARHATEVALVEHLMSRGVPVVPVSRVLAPGPHACGPCAATFWEFIDGEPAYSLAPDVAGPLLRDLHAAMAEYHGPRDLDLWSRALDAAGAMLADPAALGRLDASDRALLHRLYVELRAEIERSTVRLRPIHGDARGGNLLQSAAGPLWMDFEAVCLGPAEWDLASMPEGTEAWLPDVDAALLASLRRLRQVCLVISCWNQYERTREIARAAELHLRLLKDSVQG